MWRFGSEKERLNYGRLGGTRCGIAFSEVEHFDKGRGRLCARDGVFAVHDEAGHAVDAEPAGVDVGSDDLLPALVALQVMLRELCIEPGACRTIDQDGEVTDIEAILEIG